MARSSRVIVHGEEGLRGSATADALTRERGAVEVLLDDGRSIVVPISVFEKRGDNTLFLPLRPGDLPTLTGPTRHATEVEAEAVVPIVAEEAEFTKRTVETGTVRIRKTVREREQVVDQPLYREEVQVERVPVGRPMEGPVEARQEGDTMIIPVVEEVLVVEKKLMLREELRITRRRVEIRDPQAVKLRSEEVEVERLKAPADRD